MTATPEHARANALVRAWRAFRRWRRSRPFWGGLFTLLAGLEILGTARVDFGGITFQMGLSGFLVWLLPTILVTCGLLMWFTPQQRMFYAVVGALTTVFSLVAVNLGGFLIGALLGMVGTALGFAWVPVAPKPSTPEPPPPASPPPPEPTDDEPTVDNLLDGPPPRDRNSPMFVIALLLASVAAAGIAASQGTEPARAAPCPTGSPSALSSSRPAPPASATPSASPSPAAPSPPDVGNIITDIVEGIGDLFGVGEPSASQTPTPTPSPSLSPSKSTAGRPATSPPPPGSTRPSTSVGPCRPSPSTSATPDPKEKAKLQVAAPKDIPPVNESPSRMIGTKLTMWNLRFDGITELRTVDGGTMEVLQFSMRKAVTDDFQMLSTIPDGKRMTLKSSALTVEQNVRFFTPEFKGKLLGLFDAVYTPDSLPPLPEELAIPVIPIFYTNVDIQLAYVDCDKLSAPNLDNTVPSAS